MVGDMRHGNIEQCGYRFLIGPDCFVHRVNHRFHLDQSVFGLVDYYVVSLFHIIIHSSNHKVSKSF